MCVCVCVCVCVCGGGGGGGHAVGEDSSGCWRGGVVDHMQVHDLYLIFA